MRFVFEVVLKISLRGGLTGEVFTLRGEFVAEFVAEFVTEFGRFIGEFAAEFIREFEFVCIGECTEFNDF